MINVDAVRSSRFVASSTAPKSSWRVISPPVKTTSRTPAASAASTAVATLRVGSCWRFQTSPGWQYEQRRLHSLTASITSRSTRPPIWGWGVNSSMMALLLVSITRQLPVRLLLSRAAGRGEGVLASRSAVSNRPQLIWAPRRRASMTSFGFQVDHIRGRSAAGLLIESAIVT